MSPVNAALQFKLVMGLDIEQEMLVEANASHQVGPVGTFQGAPAVDVLQMRKGKEYAQRPTPSATTCSSNWEISFCSCQNLNHISLATQITLQS